MGKLFHLKLKPVQISDLKLKKGGKILKHRYFYFFNFQLKGVFYRAVYSDVNKQLEIVERKDI